MTEPADGPVLCLNAGSSSLKAAVFGGGEDGPRLRTAAVGGVGTAAARLVVRDAAGATRHEEALPGADAPAALTRVLDALAADGHAAFAAVGHRLVHGGPGHAAPARATPELVAALRAVVPLAPLHLPVQLDFVAAVARRLGDVPQVVCFDTAFHRTLPPHATRLPLPAALLHGGLRRYGFHGLSCEWVVSALRAARTGRVVIAHLGAGASLTAVRDGRSVETTMGLTPLGGCLMATRPGDLDPGVLPHLLATGRCRVDALDAILERESGLRAVSGTTGDMATLLARRAEDPEAALAVAMFCYQVRCQVGRLAAALGGLDALVFTGGIGLHAAAVREEVCAGLGHLGVALDPARNAAGAGDVSAAGARCAVHVVAADEERVIARHARRVLRGASGGDQDPPGSGSSTA